MNVQETSGYGIATGIWWADGLDGQEDELDDVQKGKLDPPTDDEGPGAIFEPNDSAVALEKEDEDDEVIEADETQRPN